MNREIKFRGKRLDNGEFIFGVLAFFFNQPDNTCIMPNCFFGTRDFGDVDEKDNAIISDEIALGGFINVDPNTVGQYTGLKDKNGVEIYEGDIVKPFTDEKHLAHVIFTNGSFKILTKDSNGNYNSWRYFKDEIEVIGNVHENPEML